MNDEQKLANDYCFFIHSIKKMMSPKAILILRPEIRPLQMKRLALPAKKGNGVTVSVSQCQCQWSVALFF
jgi:hypothetical protein